MPGDPVQLPRGWQAQLRLRFEADSGRTVLARREHAGPLLVQRMFHPEEQAGGPCHAYIIHPPGGVASGDDLELDVSVHDHAHALLTTPAAGKFYRRGAAGRARARQRLHVEHGVLEWLPQENIFFPEADVELHTSARLAGDARFIGWEIGCMGLPAIDRGLEGGCLRLGFELWHDEQPLLLERLTLTRASAEARTGLGGRVAFGTMLAFPAGARELELARAAAAGDCTEPLLACTLVDGVLIGRGTAQRADRLRQAFVRWWRALRPALLGREAVAPRIWFT